jgi:hypothetical protein
MQEVEEQLSLISRNQKLIFLPHLRMVCYVIAHNGVAPISAEL